MQDIMPNLCSTASHPSQEDSDWSEEDCDDELKDEDNIRKKQRKEKLEKVSSYYPPEPIYNSSPEKEVPILVTDLIPAPVQREIKC